MIFIKKCITIWIYIFISHNMLAQNIDQGIVRSGTDHKLLKKSKRSGYFADNASVTMADGSIKSISEIKIGEDVKTCRNGKTDTTQVKQVDFFEKPSSLLTAVYLRPTRSIDPDNEQLVPALLLEATPHHRVQTAHGKKKMKRLGKDDILFRYEPATGNVSTWKVGLIHTKARRVSKAYNIETEEGTYLVGNMVMAQ
jgi:hypothetical protein